MAFLLTLCISRLRILFLKKRGNRREIISHCGFFISFIMTEASFPFNFSHFYFLHSASATCYCGSSVPTEFLTIVLNANFTIHVYPLSLLLGELFHHFGGFPLQWNFHSTFSPLSASRISWYWVAPFTNTFK